MLRDSVRCKLFQNAILANVKPNDVILDVGAGTGLLSIFAARAGARKVYAIERTQIASMISVLAKRNGVLDKIEVIEGDAEGVDLPENVDIIISEWLGACVVEENMLWPLLVCRDRWLKPSGRILPDCVTAWMAPVFDTMLAKGLAFWRSNPYNVDLTSIADATTQEPLWGRHHIGLECLLSKPQALWKINVSRFETSAARMPFNSRLKFEVKQAGRINGLAVWFSAMFPNAESLSTGPEAGKTHWGRLVMPLSRGYNVEPGVGILVKTSIKPTNTQLADIIWSAKIGNSSWERHHPKNAYLRQFCLSSEPNN